MHERRKALFGWRAIVAARRNFLIFRLVFFTIICMQEDDKQLNAPAREEKILAFWEQNDIFARTLKKTAKGNPYVFYEGPPTANAAPGIHHLESRSFKDVLPRYKTMRGFFVARKAGWDTHGLPVEIQVEKKLGLTSKKDIETFGVAAFNKECRDSVWQFKGEWEKSTKRIGFWLDLEHPYITYQTDYMESLWAIMKEIWKKGFLYEDFKVVPWCARCGTGLSTHELGQPGAYQTLKEHSVYVMLAIVRAGGGKDVRGEEEHLLVWTTTPWTLQANVAVAVNPTIEYSKWRIQNWRGSGKACVVWSATTPPFNAGEEVELVEKVSGQALLGVRYAPALPLSEALFRNPAYRRGNVKDFFMVIPGDFVSTEEGTGMVHIAPAFGDDDMRAVKRAFGEAYPILFTVNPDGAMKAGTTGAGVFAKTADPEIIKELGRRKVLYFIKPYEHEYPHCWRCNTPLLYFAKRAWWIRMNKVKDQLLANNKTVNWTPAHLKDGRFGEFLRELRDWAFSRERFWGTPLPVWRCAACLHEDVIGSLEELHTKSGGAHNAYIAMRHGESVSNIQNVCAARNGYQLTLKGRKQVEQVAKGLKKKGIDLIFASPLERTRATAEIVGKALGLPVAFDDRLLEVNVGDFEGHPGHMYHSYFSSYLEKFTKRPPNGETLSELRARVMDFMRDIEQKYHGKKILIVSHEYTIWMLWSGALGWSDEATIAARTGKRREDFVTFAAPEEFLYKHIPRDETGTANLHRPYVDDFTLPCAKCGKTMRRVPEVVDVWFDSGSMPFAQAHWPFSKESQKLSFPAEYISEAIDQTRGWFYTLLAVATLLGRGAPYKNVISLGHVLDKNGQKMSKSKGNAIKPDEMIQKYGADAIRWYFYTINAPGDPKRFDEKDLQNKVRGFLGTLWNVFVFFDTYVDSVKITSHQKSKNVLDVWVLVKLGTLVRDVSTLLDAYDVGGAARAIEEFVIGDLSNWYIRRSRRRFQKPETKKEKEEAAATTGYVLSVLVRLTAPFVPFISEAIWQGARKKLGLKEVSVHLADWPAGVKKERISLELQMDKVRSWAADALKQRASAGIKVRQPLAKFIIAKSDYGKKEPFAQALLDILKDEINVKGVEWGNVSALDTVITSELKEEGFVREIVRNIQEMRKDLGLNPQDAIRVQFSSSTHFDDMLLRWKALIQKEAGAKQFVIGGKKMFKAERELEAEGGSVWVGIDKV